VRSVAPARLFWRTPRRKPRHMRCRRSSPTPWPHRSRSCGDEAEELRKAEPAGPSAGNACYMRGPRSWDWCKPTGCPGCGKTGGREWAAASGRSVVAQQPGQAKGPSTRSRGIGSARSKLSRTGRDPCPTVGSRARSRGAVGLHRVGHRWRLWLPRRGSTSAPPVLPIAGAPPASGPGPLWPPVPGEL